MTFKELQASIVRCNTMMALAGYCCELRVKQSNGYTMLNLAEVGKSAYLRTLTSGSNDQCALASLAFAVEMALETFQTQKSLFGYFDNQEEDLPN